MRQAGYIRNTTATSRRTPRIPIRAATTVASELGMSAASPENVVMNVVTNTTRHGATPTRSDAHAISDLGCQRFRLVTVAPAAGSAYADPALKLDRLANTRARGNGSEQSE
jgi:hypothetical protein